MIPSATPHPKKGFDATYHFLSFDIDAKHSDILFGRAYPHSFTSRSFALLYTQKVGTKLGVSSQNMAFMKQRIERIPDYTFGKRTGKSFFDIFSEGFKILHGFVSDNKISEQKLFSLSADMKGVIESEEVVRALIQSVPEATKDADWITTRNELQTYILRQPAVEKEFKKGTEGKESKAAASVRLSRVCAVYDMFSPRIHHHKKRTNLCKA
jgi:hypothetical protein